MGAGPRFKPFDAPTITLALAIFKFDRMEWAIEKCTEIGVARIVPVIARRSDAHLAAAAAKRQRALAAHRASGEPNSRDGRRRLRLRPRSK
jgi:16S rRNA U1498 N3-methylase RsmE